MRSLPTAEVAHVLITHPNAYALQDLVRRERRRGAVMPLAPVSLVEPGLYGVWVEQYRPVQAAWVRPFRLGAATSVAGLAALALVWWLVSLALAALPFLIGAAVLLLAGRLAVRDRGCTITHRRH